VELTGSTFLYGREWNRRRIDISITFAVTILVGLVERRCGGHVVSHLPVPDIQRGEYDGERLCPRWKLERKARGKLRGERSGSIESKGKSERTKQGDFEMEGRKVFVGRK
jgi:hypothetical protein